MQVKSIIKLVCTYLQLTELLEDELLGGSKPSTEENKKDINLLVECVNLSNNLVATEYLPLKSVSVQNSPNGVIQIQSLSFANIYEIINVKNQMGKSLVFKVFGDILKTVPGYVEITYSYFPESVSLNSEITDYSLKLTERIFAYGVASEFCFIKGLYEEASMWDNRFKESLRCLVRPKKNIVMPAKRW